MVQTKSTQCCCCLQFFAHLHGLSWRRLFNVQFGSACCLALCLSISAPWIHLCVREHTIHVNRAIIWTGESAPILHYNKHDMKQLLHFFISLKQPCSHLLYYHRLVHFLFPSFFLSCLTFSQNDIDLAIFLIINSTFIWQARQMVTSKLHPLKRYFFYF